VGYFCYFQKNQSPNLVILSLVVNVHLCTWVGNVGFVQTYVLNFKLVEHRDEQRTHKKLPIYFCKKNLAKKWRFCSNYVVLFFQKFDLTLVFENNANFLPKTGKNRLQIVIITLAPAQ
jgi:hypothetical protein